MGHFKSLNNVLLDDQGQISNFHYFYSEFVMSCVRIMPDIHLFLIFILIPGLPVFSLSGDPLYICVTRNQSQRPTWSPTKQVSNQTNPVSLWIIDTSGREEEYCDRSSRGGGRDSFPERESSELCLNWCADYGIMGDWFKDLLGWRGQEL